MNVKQVFMIVLVFTLLSTTSVVFSANVNDKFNNDLSISDDFTVESRTYYEIDMISSFLNESEIIADYSDNYCNMIVPSLFPYVIKHKE